jgi:hypothetical protein
MAKDFTTTFLVDESPAEVFNAVLNVRAWWQGLYSEQFDGKTENLNDEFTFRAGDGAHHTRQKLVELIPNEKVAWLVTFSELTFITKKDEWKNTKIIFDISKKGAKTQLQFTHQGLMPDIECYDTCSTVWDQYLKQKLLPLIKSLQKQSSKQIQLPAK